MIWPFKRSETRSTNQAPGGDSYWQDFAALRTGPVNAATAQGVTTVWSCVDLIASTIGSLPLILYRRKDDDRERATDHSLYRVLHLQANPQMTALECREYLQASVLLHGNGYARIERGSDGQTRALWPLNPANVSLLRSGDKLIYEYSDRNGKLVRLLQDEMFHVRYRLADDGVTGISPIQACREAIGLAISERDHGVNSYANGTKLSGVLKYAQVLRPEQRQTIREGWQSQYAGGTNAGRVALLEAGVDFQPLSMNMVDAQWLESRQFSVAEICRVFRVPPTLVGDLAHGTYSNSESMMRQFVSVTLGRHMKAFEQAVSTQLLTDVGRRTYHAEFSAEGLLRGNGSERAAFYGNGIASGWLLPSEARRLENLPVVPGIDNQPKPERPTPKPPVYPSKEA